MAPKRLPWSVSAMAGNFCSLALATSFSSWAAPSSRMYSEWTWRWTNSLCCIRRADLRSFHCSPRDARAYGSSGAARLARRVLLPLDRAGRLRGHIEDDPVDPLHLVDDAIAHLAE